MSTGHREVYFCWEQQMMQKRIDQDNTGGACGTHVSCAAHMAMWTRLWPPCVILTHELMHVNNYKNYKIYKNYS